MTIPGPWFAKLTYWWLAWYEMLDRRQEFIDRLHKQYGSVVQIAPRMISVNNAKGLQEVYSMTRKLDRPALPSFHTYKSDNLVSTESAILHNERRRPMRRLYTKRSIDSMEMQELFREKTKQVVDFCKSEVQSSHTVGAKPALRYMACDIMSAIVYGERFALDLLHDKQDRVSMQADFKWQDEILFNTWGLISSVFPDFVMFLRTWNLAPASMDGSLPDGLHMHEIGMKALNHALKASLQAHKDEDPSLIGILVAQYGQHLTPKDQNYILSEGLDHFWAGIVTITDVLSALLLRLSLPGNSGKQERLRQELLDHNLNRDLSHLKFLDCILKETLRLHSPFDGSLDRISDSGIVIDGVEIPPNMEIGGQAYSIHRNAELFPSPDTWEPERWDVDPESDLHRSMNRQFFAFGAGPRMCIGMNIAWSVMRYAVASIYGSFKTTLLKEFLVDLESEDGLQERIKSWMEDEERPIHLELL